MPKKILKFTAVKTGKVTMLQRPIPVVADTKRSKLLPILTLNYFKKKRKKDD